MPVQFVKGDIFASGLEAYAQGCNCSGAMDAGVSIAFKKKWPRMYEEYKARCADKRFKLGDVFVWTEENVTVYNIGIQEHWKAKATLAALKRGVSKMLELASAAGVKKIGLPRIGTGLGGLDWQRVKSVLSEAAGSSPIELVVFEQFIRSKPEAASSEP